MLLAQNYLGKKLHPARSAIPNPEAEQIPRFAAIYSKPKCGIASSLGRAPRGAEESSWQKHMSVTESPCRSPQYAPVLWPNAATAPNSQT
jgi:hypothetical protein